RYRQLVGKTAVLPLVGRKLPIVADDAVEKDFGTGALKVTPGHDPMDYEIGQRHGLEIVNGVHEDGSMNVPGLPYDGLPALEDRPAAVAWTPRACLPLRQRPCCRVGRSSGRLPRVRKYKADPGSGCSGHVVLVGSLAVCHPRLAGRDRRPRGLLSDGHELHRA